MPAKILAIVSQPVSADALRAAVGPEKANDAEVLVIAPALQTRRHFLLADPDQGIERAEAIQEETVERLEEEGVDAVATTGESEPALAIQDALATFPAERVVVFTHPGGDRDYREDDGLKDAERRFGVPVVFAEIGR